MHIVSAMRFFFGFNIIIFHSFISFCALKICEFTECLKIYLFKIKENVEEARKNMSACLNLKMIGDEEENSVFV